MPSDSEMRERLAAIVAVRATPTRNQWQRRSRRILWVGGLWSACVTLVLMRRTALNQTEWWLLSALTFGALVIQAAYFLFNRAGAALGRSRVSMTIAALVALLVPVAGALAAGSFVHSMPHALSARAHLACLVTTLVVAAGPFVSILWTLHGTDYVRPRATGLLVGALSGVIGGAGMSLHCAENAMAHLLLGHVLPIALLGAVGWAIGQRIMGGRLRFSDSRLRDRSD